MKFRTVAAGLMGLCLAGIAGAQTEEEKTFYKIQETFAGPSAKAKLATLRAEIAANHYTFSVGATSKLEADLTKITGFVKPPDAAAQASKHAVDVVGQKVARDKEVSDLVKLIPNIPWPIIIKPIPITIYPASFDWRTQGDVTMVMDQGQAGTCWACSSCGALDASDMKRNSQYATSSVQQVVTCSGGGTVNGGYFPTVLQWFVTHGVTYSGGGICPYLAIQGTSAQQATWNGLISTYKASAWDYCAPGGVKASTDQMKSAILAHGPILTGIDATHFNGYAGGVINVPSSSSDHAVMIIGWDDSMGAFIIKNSWGHDWGIACGFGKEKGYCYVAYNDCNIGDTAAWVDASVPPPGVPWYY